MIATVALVVLSWANPAAADGKENPTGTWRWSAE
jgi:hypothetical protein